MRRTTIYKQTSSSAVALRDYFQSHAMVVTSLNVLTEGTHARRSRMLFQQAFGPGVAVGVIAVPDPDYDPARWWRYSEGVRTVLSESIAWVYAEFLFRPGNSRLCRRRRGFREIGPGQKPGVPDAALAVEME